MKKLITLLLISLAGNHLELMAQQINQFDQFNKNSMVFNPATTGMEHYTDVSGNFRRQWVGFDDAPRSFLVSINSRKMEKSLTTTELPSIIISDNSMYDQVNTTKETRVPTPHAFGAYIISDGNGPFERLSAFVNYAYHLKVSENSTLAFGVGAGYSRREIDVNSLELVSTNDNTFNSFLTNDNASDYFDLKAGLTFYGRNYFIGYGANQLNRKELYQEINGSIGRLDIHHNFSAGYIFDLNESLELYPTVLVRMVDPAPIAYDGALKLRFEKKFWLGAGYRHDDAVSGQLGLTIANRYNFGYSYAFSTSEIKNANDGSHEISLGIMLHNSVEAPTKMW